MAWCRTDDKPLPEPMMTQFIDTYVTLGGEELTHKLFSEYIFPKQSHIYRKVSNISRTLVDNKIVDHSDVVGASPVGAVPTTSSFST